MAHACRAVNLVVYSQFSRIAVRQVSGVITRNFNGHECIRKATISAFKVAVAGFRSVRIKHEQRLADQTAILGVWGIASSESRIATIVSLWKVMRLVLANDFDFLALVISVCRVLYTLANRNQ